MRQFQVFVRIKVGIDGRKHWIQVRGHKNVERCRTGIACAVIDCRNGLKLLYVVFVGARQYLRLQVGTVECLVGNKSHCKELVLEPNPFQTLVNLFLVVRRFRQIFRIAACIFVIYCRITFFKHASFLLAQHCLPPYEIHRSSARRNNIVHSLLLYVEPGNVAVGRKGIAQCQRRAVAQVEAHQDRRIVHLRWREIELARVKLAVRRCEYKRIFVILPVGNQHVAATETLIIF